jgi:Flp pilus assembly CpaF family ATPase
LRIKQLIEEGLQGGKADPEVIAEAVGLVVVIQKTSVAPGRRVSEMVRVEGYEDGAYVLVDDFSESLTATPTKNEH